MQKFTGLEYIKIDLANQFGMGNSNWDTRLNWVNKTNKCQQGLEKMISTAKEPILFEKALNALRDAENSIPTGFIMSLDATASSLQIMAILSGCHITARNVNLIDTGNRENAHQKTADMINIMTGNNFTAKQVKPAIMTSFYNSKAEPKKIFGVDTPELSVFYDTIHQLFTGAINVLNTIQSCQSDKALAYMWTLPDQHTARTKVMAPVEKKIEIDELNHATFTHRAYVNTPTDFDLSLPAKIVQSIDGYIVREMYRLADEQKFELLTIHDSFWASPNYMQNVRENYKNILAAIAEINLLETIVQELTGNNKFTYIKFSNTLGDEIRKSEYCLS